MFPSLPNDVQPLLYNVAQVAQALGIGRDAVYELIARGELPVVRLGERSVRIPRHLLERWVEAKATPGPVATVAFR